ncbi:MAG: YgjV family protein [Clostridia bacterium]|nr:YgjV family protein [Clostridia bacterium]
MNPKIAFELFGYAGTFLVIFSMTMTNVNKLRFFNICGSVISAIYAAVYGTWPIVLMNVCLVFINLFHLIRSKIRKIYRNINNSAIGEVE